MASEEVQRLARVRMQVTGESFEQALAALEGRDPGGTGQDSGPPAGSAGGADGAGDTGGADGAEAAGGPAREGARVIGMAGRRRAAEEARGVRRRPGERPR
ncbi:hypothetical protein [Streptomyces zingiberis]|uniref:Uncharacterized protein n=1 Tax=Streptomyces zingiberis TaxID=2053010 RepID=A0ABX1C414_9ACTN|nr:hypothetical protein [Streptomyces zingiberis]NJQ01669.1 hypothetical protein [Streptomyces zingiberis]